MSRSSGLINELVSSAKYIKQLEKLQPKAKNTVKKELNIDPLAKE